ncbi:MAG: hypothetical protein HOL23_03535 [Gammaproteobacteria bacterium]|nr:hypothetical protein [Gammaproteobacteria bacterium]
MGKQNHEFSRLEYTISKLFSKFPYFKQCLKRLYRLVLVVLYFNSTKRLETSCELHEVHPEGETFFGYYDHSPLNISGEYCAFHQSFLDTSKKQFNKPINIMIKNIKTNQSSKVSESYAFNWQQGARLQWISKDQIIFNNFETNSQKVFAQIYNINTQKLNDLNVAIYESSKTFSLTLSFERLNKFAIDYGYLNLPINIKELSKDGIFYVDHEKNTCNLLWSLHTMSSMINQQYILINNQHVNHIMLSPDNKNCMFLHRVETKNKTIHTLFCGDLNSEKIKILISGMVSHCSWLNNDKIIAYLDYEGTLGYFLIDINTRLITKLKNTDIHTFGDGHPTVSGNKMVFDTYPNRKQLKSLFLVDLNSNRLSKIAEVYEPLKFFGYSRCDLHPRFVSSACQIWIDSTHSGKRQLYYLDLHE